MAAECGRTYTPDLVGNYLMVWEPKQGHIEREEIMTFVDALDYAAAICQDYVKS